MLIRAMSTIIWGFSFLLVADSVMSSLPPPPQLNSRMRVICENRDIWRQRAEKSKADKARAAEMKASPVEVSETEEEQDEVREQKLTSKQPAETQAGKEEKHENEQAKAKERGPFDQSPCIAARVPPETMSPNVVLAAAVGSMSPELAPMSPLPPPATAAPPTSPPS